LEIAQRYILTIEIAYLNFVVI